MIYKEVTEVTYCAVPFEDFESWNWTIKVAWRSPGQYAVLNRMTECLGKSGKWSYESMPSSRTDFWKKNHRFDFETACELAEKAVKKIRLFGCTPEQVEQWREYVRAGGRERLVPWAIDNGILPAKVET